MDPLGRGRNSSIRGSVDAFCPSPARALVAMGGDDSIAISISGVRAAVAVGGTRATAGRGGGSPGPPWVLLWLHAAFPPSWEGWEMELMMECDDMGGAFTLMMPTALNC